MLAERIADFNRIGLADAALAAQQGGFGSVEAYPELLTKGAVLCRHLVKNRPLPDGNKPAPSWPRSISSSATVGPDPRAR